MLTSPWEMWSGKGPGASDHNPEPWLHGFCLFVWWGFFVVVFCLFVCFEGTPGFLESPCSVCFRGIKHAEKISETL